MGLSVIEVVVGTGAAKGTFVVHEALFTARSGFFRSAVKDGRTKPEQLIELPGDESRVFRLYVILTYSGAVATKSSKQVEWWDLTRLYILAEKLQDTWAKNRVIDAMYSYLKSFSPYPPDPASMNALYAGTPDNSPARKLLVEWYASGGSQDLILKAKGSAKKDLLPIDFVFDLALRGMEKESMRLFGPMLNGPCSQFYEPEANAGTQANATANVNGSKK